MNGSTSVLRSRSSRGEFDRAVEHVNRLIGVERAEHGLEVAFVEVSLPHGDRPKHAGVAQAGEEHGVSARRPAGQEDPICGHIARTTDVVDDGQDRALVAPLPFDLLLGRRGQVAAGAGQLRGHDDQSLALGQLLPRPDL